jgi:pimeloyl-ACP methyl ester carboxylesterase
MLTSTRSGFHGVEIALEGSSSDPDLDLFLVHATGFCKELWRPVARPLLREHASLAWLAMDQRGHGASGQGEPPYEWDLLARDVLAVIGDGRARLGVGHSSGGAAIARAEILRPGTFDGLVLIEPIIFPPPFGRRDIPLATRAERRRATFPDRTTARQRFADGPFATWEPEVLDLYIDHAFTDDGGGRSLRCNPQVEADFYREGTHHDTWDGLSDIDVPVILVVGEHSDSPAEPFVGLLRDRFRHADLVIVPGVGHLAPMEAPESIATIIGGALRDR